MNVSSLKENATHGTVSFPLALYEWDGSNAWRVAPHWHDEMELICLKKGTFQVWINTKEYTITAPAMLCIHPGEIHSIMLEKGCVESAIVFNLNILSFEHYDAIQAKLLGPLMDGRLKMPVLVKENEAVFSQMKQSYEKMEQKIKIMEDCNTGHEMKKNAAYLQIKAILFELLAVLYEKECFISNQQQNKSDEVQIENLKKVIGYINENYACVIRLEELAQLVNMNAQYLCRYFKKYIGKTIMEYVNEIRIEKAAEALAETKDKVIDIAQNVGFENTGYFIRRFKKEKGVTPSEYRKKSK